MSGENYIRSVETALAQGNTSAAIAAATRGLKESPDSLELKLWMGIALEFCGQNTRAIRVFEQAHDQALITDAPLQIKGKIKYAFAISLLGTDNYGRAAYLLHEAAEIFPDNPGIYESLVKASLKMGAVNKAREYGQLALELLDHSVDTVAGKLNTPGLQRPKLFNARNRKTNVIACALYGNDPFLQECAIQNTKLALDLFPEFTYRIYCDSRITLKTRKELVRFKAELQLMPAPDTEWEPHFWPMWAFDDPNVNVVLVRNAKAPLSAREYQLVRKWLFGSTLPFHVIRDSLLQSTPIPEGLWGGFTRLLPQMQLNTKIYLKKYGNNFAHQRYLLKQIWPRMRGNCLAHDRHFELPDNRNPGSISASGPVDKAGKEHSVGWQWPAASDSN